MNWINISSLEELQSLGKFNQIKEIINKDLDPILIIKARSWSDLYVKVNQIQKMLEKLQTKSTFTSKSSEYIFYLTELSGEARMNKLQIDKTHFTNKKKSKQWRDKIAKEIHPDKSNHPKSEQAMSKLNELYAQMVGKE